MKILKKREASGIFPMRVECRRVADRFGFAYGNEIDFCGSSLEIEAEDIKKHVWFKYPDYKGIDYGVLCPVCKKFIVIDTEKIPRIVRDNAKQITISQ